ncbi:CDP-alcohol phosphatidyltransferase family protein [Candidatus Woesearchaeota archaeon]|nr:MAG: CDP-alcohol phosphatidyltransferase family protein [Candidatus Woesearchaeota archaeon]
MNVADAVTIVRIIIAPLLYAAGILREEVLFLVLFIVGAVSDGLDGFLARRLPKKSSYGNMLDGVADSLFYPALLFVFVFVPELKEYAVLILSVFVAQVCSMLWVLAKGRAGAPHNVSGKVNAGVMVLFVVASLVSGFSQVLVWVLAVSGFVSAADRVRSAL